MQVVDKVSRDMGDGLGDFHYRSHVVELPGSTITLDVDLDGETAGLVRLEHKPHGKGATELDGLSREELRALRDLCDAFLATPCPASS